MLQCPECAQPVTPVVYGSMSCVPSVNTDPPRRATCSPGSPMIRLMYGFSVELTGGGEYDDVAPLRRSKSVGRRVDEHLVLIFERWHHRLAIDAELVDL